MISDMTADDLEQILADHPTLCDFGFQSFEYNHRRIHRLTDAEFAKQLEEERTVLRSHLDQVNVCLQWLKGVERRKTITAKRSSYGLKHCVERSVGVYVSNGAFIAAAIFAGLKVQRCEPNAFFNIAEKFIRERKRNPPKNIAGVTGAA